jgi:hypothetical protein
LVCNSYPIAPDDAKEYGERFCQPPWRYLGCIFAYRNPEGGTQFEAHPDPEVSDEKWIQMMKAPVFGTGLTYREKIMCRLTGLSDKQYLALKNEEGESSKEPGACIEQASKARSRVPSSNRTAGFAQEGAEARMKNTRLEDLPKHKCVKSGKPSLGYARLDFDAMKSLIERDASKQEISGHISACIADDAARNPNPTEPEFERFKAAMMKNTPFAIYCTRCLELVCLIHPEQVDDTAGSTGESVSKGEITMTMKKKDTSEEYDAGWRDAIEAFHKQWEAKPDNLSSQELITCTNRLLLLLHPDTENLTEEEISKRI